MNRLAFCLYFLLFTTSVRLSATHIVGGELTYKCLGNDTVEVTLTVFRDCYTGVPWFDDPAAIGIYDNNWILQSVLVLPLDSMANDTLPIILSNPCLTVPPDVCAHGTRYVAKAYLPPIRGGYHIVYQRCCRNELIRNIVNPLATGITIISTVTEEALLACNNSAVFNQWPPVAICVHEPIDFDHSATDPDGDSLVYKLCTPLHGATMQFPMPQPPNKGPYQEVVWLDPPYNLDNVLGGDPLTIDPATGFLTGIPDMIGNFVVGICVEEYRDGQLLSITRRDFQYNVADCGRPYAAFFVPEVICDTLSVKFLNESLQTNDYLWYFDWEGDTTKTSGVYSPTYMFPDTGYYTIVLISEPDDPCRDTAFQTIHLTQSYIDAELAFQFPECDNDGLIVQATDLSVDPTFGIVAWQWVLKGPGGGALAQSDQQNPTFTVMDPGDYTLELTTTSGNGCTETVTLPFNAPIPPLNIFKDSLLICIGDTIALLNGADPSFNYQWSPSTALSSDTAPNPLAFPAATTTYMVTITGNGPCVIQKEVKLKVVDTNTLTASAVPSIVLPGGQSQLSAFAPGAISYSWQPPTFLSQPDIPNPVSTPTLTTEYVVKARLPGGCVALDTVRVEVREVLCDEPYVFFPTGFSPNGDGENDKLKLESLLPAEVYWVIYNRWGQKLFEANSLDDAWDGTYNGEAQPAETYGYYLRVFCQGGGKIEKQGNVTLLR